MSFASLLNDTCTIYSRVESIDEETGEQFTKLSTVAESISCALQHSSGGLNQNSRLITGTNSYRLYLFPPDFELKKVDHIVEVSGVQYRITGIKDLGGRKTYLRLDLERVALDE